MLPQRRKMFEQIHVVTEQRRSAQAVFDIVLCCPQPPRNTSRLTSGPVRATALPSKQPKTTRPLHLRRLSCSSPSSTPPQWHKCATKAKSKAKSNISPKTQSALPSKPPRSHPPPASSSPRSRIPLPGRMSGPSVYSRERGGR